MNIIKLFSLIVFFCTSLCLTVGAESVSEIDQYYNEQITAVNIEESADALDNSARKILEDMGVDISSIDRFSPPDLKSVFKVIINCFKNGIKTPLKITLSAVGIILIFTLVNATVPLEENYGGYNIFLVFTVVLIFFSSLYELLTGCEAVLKSLSAFLVVFIPCLCGVLTALGYTVTSAGASAMLVMSLDAMSLLSSYVLIPSATAVMCLGIGAGASPLGGVSTLCAYIKKCVLWCVGIASGIFSSVLGMQTAVSAAGDNIAVRASKTLITGIFPVMGPTLAETLNTARGSLLVLKSGVAIYGIVAIISILLPIVISLLCWRLGFAVCRLTAEFFEIKGVSTVFESVDFCVTILLGSTVFIGMLYIISVATVSGVQ